MSALINLLVQLIGVLTALYGCYLVFGGPGLIAGGVITLILGGAMEFAAQPKKEVSS